MTLNRLLWSELYYLIFSKAWPLRHAVCTVCALKPWEIHDVKTKAVNMDSWSFTVTTVWTDQPHILSLCLSVIIRHDTCHKLSGTTMSKQCLRKHTRALKSLYAQVNRQDSRGCWQTRVHIFSPVAAQYCSRRGFGSVPFARLCLWWGAQTCSETSTHPSLVWKQLRNIATPWGQHEWV